MFSPFIIVCKRQTVRASFLEKNLTFLNDFLISFFVIDMKRLYFTRSVHFHALKNSFFTVRQECAAIFFEEGSGSVDIAGCDRKAEYICLWNNKYLSFIEGREDKKVTSTQNRASDYSWISEVRYVSRNPDFWQGGGGFHTDHPFRR